jgi:hypothetical protein
MDQILKLVYNACDPYEPASSQYYEDCGEARGKSELTDRFLKELQLANDHLCVLFSGHIGCGKSSELAHLRDKLKAPPSGHPPYFPIVLDVSDYLDDFDASLTDILLAIVTEVATTVRDEVSVEMKDPYFTKRINEVKEFFLSDIEMDGGELSLPAVKLKIQRLKRKKLDDLCAKRLYVHGSDSDSTGSGPARRPAERPHLQHRYKRRALGETC